MFAKVRNADIVVSAAGRAGLVKGHWIRPGAVVVDVAMNTQGQSYMHLPGPWKKMHLPSLAEENLAQQILPTLYVSLTRMYLAKKLFPNIFLLCGTR